MPSSKSARLYVVIGLLAMSAATSLDVGAAAVPFTVQVDIATAHFGDPYGLEAESMQVSPNAEYIAAYVERGRLDLNRPEGELRIYRSRDIREALKSRAPSLDLTPVWALVRSTDSDGPVMTQWRWLADSSGLAYLERHAYGTHQLILADLASKTTKPLTPTDVDVRAFDIRNGAHYVYASAEAEPSAPDTGVRTGSVTIGTGKTFEDLLFSTERHPPGMVAWNDRTELWAVVERERFAVRNKATGQQIVMFEAGQNQMALSPDGQSLITELPVAEVPKAWETMYLPSSAESPDILHAGRQDLSSSDGAKLVSQYVRIDLTKGLISPLTNAPTAPAAGWFYGSAVSAWSPNGKAVVLPGTFISRQQGIAQPPCLAIARFEPLSVTCVEALHGDTTAGPEAGAFVTHIAFDGPGAGRFSTTDLEPIRGLSTYIEEVAGHWRKTRQHPGREARGHIGLQVDVQQDLNDPPVLVVKDPRTHKPRPFWNPNPQLNSVDLGEARVYRWKDPTGRATTAGLFLPSRMEPGRRYPLVIQTHGFGEHRFEPSGVFPTAFAARALAAVGIVVIQDSGGCGPISGPNEGPCNVRGYEQLVNELVHQGFVDPDRIGIIGFSRTCYYVMEALTTSTVHFRAASITDGVNLGYLQYILNVDINGNHSGREADAMMGAAPFAAGLPQWLKQSPEFNMDKVTAALQVVALSPVSLPQMWEPYAAMRFLHKPVELILLYNNAHVLSNPSARLASQGGSVDWFRFWLQDYEDSDTAKAEQYRRWRDLRKMATTATPEPATNAN